MITVWDGEVTPEYWRSNITNVVGAEAWADAVKIISDQRRATLVGFTNEVLDSMVAIYRAELDVSVEPRRMALIAADSWSQADYFRDAATRAGALVTVCNSVSLAARTLGLDLDHVVATIEALRDELARGARGH